MREAYDRHPKAGFMAILVLTAALLAVLLFGACSGPEGVLGTGTLHTTSDGPRMSGAAAGGIAVHSSEGGRTELAGQSTPPDNVKTVNPDNSYHASSTLPGTTIIFDQFVYDGVADLAVDEATVRMDPETGVPVEILVKGLAATRSEPIRADAEQLAAFRDMVLGLSEDQRAAIEAVMPGLLDLASSLIGGP